MRPACCLAKRKALKVYPEPTTKANHPLVQAIQIPRGEAPAQPPIGLRGKSAARRQPQPGLSHQALGHRQRIIVPLQAFRCATTRGVMLPPSRKAARPARWVNTEAHEVLNSISLPMEASIEGGMTSQPRRQPVIRKLLEKLCATTRRSSGSARSRKLGAQALAEGS